MHKVRFLDGTAREFQTLSGADLARADLFRANLRGADLTGANLRDTELSGVDLTSAIGLPDAPIVEDLIGRIPTDDTLRMGDWHCRTAHCLAGWAITHAGEAGAELEQRLGPSTAGALIWYASTGIEPDFYMSDDEALEWLAQMTVTGQ